MRSVQDFVAQYTRHSHVRRVAHFAVRLGQAAGVPASQLGSLHRSARLHDIGKVAMARRIIDKVGPLAPDEVAVVRQHTLVGEEIVRGVGVPDDVAQAIRHHHERWDGSGYPDGLAGTAIPQLSRIIAIVDAYDAMIHDRPYRSRRSRRAAIVELLRCSGTQFDPVLTGLFVRDILRAGPFGADELLTLCNVDGRAGASYGA